ncbi:hypothetical protein E2P84_22685 [Burkholderia cepacia]|uniref:Uncharacterized protein n=1 Tax=Burkholderia cepacia TaxID=292 RepID=A0AAX2RJ72_BURCE|nr:hypothetical protein [Burkholderia cepacia]TES73167.1 hypothetical protein E2P84_22685 [Burkholderia cepacia]TES99145.1 hypothetical protein E3D36_25960 [Burkholderia cepacia]TEU40112.1 hypothetical protein E3D37_29635 [Burkholderia cepacia]TEU46950.1 hypothetical protein E3D38_24640 [Burkholderia cepacia]TEU93567.1 hypothetical protein E3D40_28205 [Burkholderia cepacia]
MSKTSSSAVTRPGADGAAAGDGSGSEQTAVGGPIANDAIAAHSIQGVAPGNESPNVGKKGESTDVSYLAKYFGADGIREGVAGAIQIHFRMRPSAELQFASADGKHLEASWDDTANVMTVGAAQKFVVRDGRSSVAVSRQTTDTFNYPADNAAGLEQVFSESGAIYFRVAEGTKKVSVRADGKALRGQQKGRYYRVAGTADSFVVNADGFEVTVTRTRSVRFVDREGGAS